MGLGRDEVEITQAPINILHLRLFIEKAEVPNRVIP
jgi:hypothetical protein